MHVDHLSAVAVIHYSYVRKDERYPAAKRDSALSANQIYKCVVGLEPTTFRLVGGCSIHLSYTSIRNRLLQSGFMRTVLV